MYYDINVSLNGKHFFATAERSCTTKKEMLTVYSELMKRFPASEGWSITVTRWESIGHHIEERDIHEEAEKVRPYDHIWDMYYDEFEDAEYSEN